MDDPLVPSARQATSQWTNEKRVLVAVLVAVNMLNYMDRFTIAGVLTSLQNYYTMTDKQSGLLQTVFIIFYLICSPFCGYCGDRCNRKVIMVAGLSVWIFAVLASSFVPSQHFWLFAFFRGLVGVGEASYSTVAPTIIADAFAGPQRSFVLMLFYFAIPVGSGLGYIGGSYVSLWAGSWQWGVRFTPLLGIGCVLLLIFFLEEPKRGEAEHAAETSITSPKEDLLYLLSNRTYLYTTGGLTGVLFAVGSLSWWAPSLIEFAYAVQEGGPPGEAEKASISLIFGLITACAGLSGVLLGSSIAQVWREGRHGVAAKEEAPAVVCAVGALAAVPALSLCLIVAPHYITFCWVLMFLSVTLMCLNWAVNMDILMYVIVAHRRATATAIQTAISHLLGDAGSPYVVGIISDAIRGTDDSPMARFSALQRALLIPNAVVIIGGAFYLYSSYFLVEDHDKAKEAMHVIEDESEEEEGSEAGDDVQVLVRH